MVLCLAELGGGGAVLQSEEQGSAGMGWKGESSELGCRIYRGREGLVRPRAREGRRARRPAITSVIAAASPREERARALLGHYGD